MDISKALNLRENAKKAYGKSYTNTEQLSNFFGVMFKISILFVMLTVNFLGLSVALNCNANSTVFKKVGVAIYAFFFGFIYLMLNYYTYRVLTLKQVCRFNKERLFPFDL
jgi:hypothetical protein